MTCTKFKQIYPIMRETVVVHELDDDSIKKDDNYTYVNQPLTKDFLWHSYELGFRDLEADDDAELESEQQVQTPNSSDQNTVFTATTDIDFNQTTYQHTKSQTIKVQFEDPRYNQIKISGWSYTKIVDPEIARVLEADPNKSYIDAYACALRTYKSAMQHPISSLEHVEDNYLHPVRIVPNPYIPYSQLLMTLLEWNLVTDGKLLPRDFYVYQLRSLNNSAHGLVEMLDNAKSVICISTFVINNKAVEDALVRACKRGVNVYMLIAFEHHTQLIDSEEEFDQKVYESYVKTAFRLVENGVIIHTMRDCHAKFIITDPFNNSACKCYVSTANFTDEGVCKNVEDFIAVTGSEFSKEITSCIEFFRAGFFQKAEHIVETKIDPITNQKVIYLKPFNPNDFAYTCKLTKFINSVVNNTFMPNIRTMEVYKHMIEPSYMVNINSYSFDHTFKLDEYIAESPDKFCNIFINANKKRFNYKYFTDLLESPAITRISDNVHIYASDRWHKKTICVLDAKEDYPHYKNIKILGSSNFTKQGLETGYELNIAKAETNFLFDRAKYKFNYQVPINNLYNFYRTLSLNLDFNKYIQLLEYNPQTQDWEETDKIIQLSDHALVFTKTNPADYQLNLDATVSSEFRALNKNFDFNSDFVSQNVNYEVNHQIAASDYLELMLQRLTSTEITISNPDLDFNQINTGNKSPVIEPLLDYCQSQVNLANPEQTFKGLPTSIYYETELTVPALPDFINRDPQAQLEICQQHNIEMSSLIEEVYGFFRTIMIHIDKGVNLPIQLIMTDVINAHFHGSDANYIINNGKTDDKSQALVNFYFSDDAKKLYLEINILESELTTNILGAYVDLAYAIKQYLVNSDQLEINQFSDIYLVPNFVNARENFVLKVPTYENSKPILRSNPMVSTINSLRISSHLLYKNLYFVPFKDKIELNKYSEYFSYSDLIKKVHARSIYNYIVTTQINHFIHKLVSKVVLKDPLAIDFDSIDNNQYNHYYAHYYGLDKININHDYRVNLVAYEDIIRLNEDFNIDKPLKIDFERYFENSLILEDGKHCWLETYPNLYKYLLDLALYDLHYTHLKPYVSIFASKDTENAQDEENAKEIKDLEKVKQYLKNRDESFNPKEE